MLETALFNGFRAPLNYPFSTIHSFPSLRQNLQSPVFNFSRFDNSLIVEHGLFRSSPPRRDSR
jgi:hypothetical protein